MAGFRLRSQESIIIFGGKPSLGVTVADEVLLCTCYMPGFHPIRHVGICQQIPFLVDRDGMRSSPLEITVLDEMMFGRLEFSAVYGFRHVRVFAQVPLFVDADAAQKQPGDFEEVLVHQINAVAIRGCGDSVSLLEKGKWRQISHARTPPKSGDRKMEAASLNR